MAMPATARPRRAPTRASTTRREPCDGDHARSHRRHARTGPHAGRAARFALALVVAALVGAAAAQPQIDPSVFTTRSGTLLTYLDRASSTSAALACYARGSDPEHSFTCLREAVRTAGLDATLSGSDRVTLFAPTDAAFRAFAKLYGQRDFDRLMRDPTRLEALLKGSMVPGRLSVRDLESRVSRATGRTTLTTLAGTELRVQFDRLMFNRPRTDVAVGSGSSRGGAWQAYVVDRSVVMDNGALIPLDMVVLPKDL